MKYTPMHFINSLNQMTYDESSPTQIFWKVYRPLFIKIISGYTLIIVCKIRFWIICLTPTWNVLCRNVLQQNPLIKNLMGTENRYVSGTAINAYTIKCVWTIMSNYWRFKWQNNEKGPGELCLTLGLASEVGSDVGSDSWCGNFPPLKFYIDSSI